MSSRLRNLLVFASLVATLLVGSGCGSRYILGFEKASAQRSDNGEKVTFRGMLHCELVGVPSCGNRQCIKAEWYRQESELPPDAGVGDTGSNSETSHDPRRDVGPDAESPDTSHGSRSDADSEDQSMTDTSSSTDADSMGDDEGEWSDVDLDTPYHETEVGDPSLASTIDETTDSPVVSVETCHDGEMVNDETATLKATSDAPIPRSGDFVIRAEISKVGGDGDRPSQFDPKTIYLKSP